MSNKPSKLSFSALQDFFSDEKTWIIAVAALVIVVLTVMVVRPEIFGIGEAGKATAYSPRGDETVYYRCKDVEGVYHKNWRYILKESCMSGGKTVKFNTRKWTCDSWCMDKRHKGKYIEGEIVGMACYCIPEESEAETSVPIKEVKVEIMEDAFNFEGDYMPGELIVEVREDISEIEHINEEFKVSYVEQVLPSEKFGESKVYLIRVPGEQDMEYVSERYAPYVKSVSLNYIVQFDATPDDPGFGGWFGVIDAPDAWDEGIGSSNVTIVVIDTGVDYDHEDLDNNIVDAGMYDVVRLNPTLYCCGPDQRHMHVRADGFCENNWNKYEWHNWGGIANVDDACWIHSCSDACASFGLNESIVNPNDRTQCGCDSPLDDYWIMDNDPTDRHGHGTHCAGLVAAETNNGIGVSGTCPECSILPIRSGFVEPTGNAMYGMGSLAAVYTALCYVNFTFELIDPDVISLSWGISVDIPFMHDIIQDLSQKGIVIVAAAGNENTDTQLYPAAYPEVIGVGATDSSDKKAYFSNYGDWVDVSAPGLGINSTIPDDVYGVKSGTSMATPIVSGVAGLLLSEKPQLTRGQVKERIVNLADDVVFGEDSWYCCNNKAQARWKSTPCWAHNENWCEDNNVKQNCSIKCRLEGYADGTMVGSSTGTSVNRYNCECTPGNIGGRINALKTVTAISWKCSWSRNHWWYWKNEDTGEIKDISGDAGPDFDESWCPDGYVLDHCENRRYNNFEQYNNADLSPNKCKGTQINGVDVHGHNRCYCVKEP